LLGRHVYHRAERKTGAGKVGLHVDGRGVCVRTGSLFHRKLSQSEIKNLCVPTLGDEDVGGFDVAVDDTFGVSRIERVGNLDSERQYGLNFHWTSADAMFQRPRHTV